MKKHILYIILAGVLFATLSFGFQVNAQSLPTITMDKPIQDMTISELQAKIAEILSVIQQLQALIAQLQGGGVSCNFYRNLYPGISGSDVKCLQQYLNNTGHTVANSGPGSPNKETIYYGSLTRAAVKKWQDANNIEPGAWWGYFGPKSQAIYNEIAGTGEQEEPPTPPLSGTYCGDSIAQRPSDQGTIEDCDGTDLRNKTCILQGYTGGTLLCSNDCSFNTSQCTGTGSGGGETPPPGPTTSCGDSIMQKPNSEGIYEVCDRTNLGTSTCLTYGYVGGTLSCSSNCITFNTTNCITSSGGGGGGGAPAPEPEPDPGPVCGDTDGQCPSGCTYSQDTDCTYCGDSIIQSPNDEGISEVCDTTSLAGETCIAKGFPGGTLQCSSTCLTFNTTSCTWPEPPNEPPVLNPIGNKTTNENNLLTFIISATDPDGDDLSYSISDRPSGAEFNASTRTFTWTPLYDQSGTYNTTFTVSDGSLTDTETITITVSNVNRAPILDSIGNKTVDENQTLTFTVSGSDLDGDTLYYSIQDSPSGASFNSSTRTFTWTPSYTQSGTYNVTFIVSDTEYADQETITITVNDVVTGPVCGDSICEGTETCSTCEADCGTCPTDFPQDYVAWWKFDGDADDSGPGGNDGILVGDAHIVSDAEKGQVLSLDGVVDYVNVGNNESLNIVNAITISAWVKPSERISDYTHIIDKGSATSISGSYTLTINGSYYYFFIRKSDNSGYHMGRAFLPFDGNWHHVVGVYDGANVYVYVDNTVGPTVSSYDGTIYSTSRDVTIGSNYDGSAYYFNGLIDHVMIYNRALSEAEILQIYNVQSQTECQQSSDCDDSNSCTINTCVGVGEAGADSRGCAVSFVSAETVCDDDLFCTTAGTSTCDGAGSCIGGIALDCSDAVSCTDDSCNEVLDTCENTVNDSNCSTGYICDVSLDCVADPCAGIDFCSDYTDSASCDDNTCVPGGCLWNSGSGICEEVEALPTTYEGFGAVTNGAEDCAGYETYHVTSLADSGAGTLRDAVSQGCRYIVFDVGGTITLESGLEVRRSYITIDGLSAPSPGITIDQQSYQTGLHPQPGQEVHDVIIHHLRMQGPGSGSGGDIWAMDAASGKIHSVIIDHITATAVGDGTFDTTSTTSDVTFSWNFVYDCNLATLIKYGDKDRISFHHNVYAKNAERQPKIMMDQQLIDAVNNVIYGWDFIGGFRIEYTPGGPNPSVNVENNVFYLWENGFYDKPKHGLIFERGPDEGDVYINGNILPPPCLPDICIQNGEGSILERLPIPVYAQVTMYDASTLGTTVVPFVGTHYPTPEEQALLSEISIALGASEARISQTDEKINSLASVLSSIQSAVQDILKRIQELF